MACLFLGWANCQVCLIPKSVFISLDCKANNWISTTCKAEISGDGETIFSEIAILNGFKIKFKTKKIYR